jgi:Fur family transcriptional regulator, ferric uptake regulator
MAARSRRSNAVVVATSADDRAVRRVRMPVGLDAAGVERALELLRDAVRRRGLRSSSVRESIARAALQRQGHFTVDDLLRDLRTTVGDVHAATVYRVLPLLVEEELLPPTLVSSSAGARYERAFEREHHDHLICRKCGKVVEFFLEDIEELQRAIAKKFGFRLSGHVHELVGTCRDCLRADA